MQLAADTGDRCLALLGRGQGAAGGRQQRLPGRGERDAPVIAHEQRIAQLSFERVDRGAQAGLHDVHPGGRAGEVQLFGDRDEMSELAQLH